MAKSLDESNYVSEELAAAWILLALALTSAYVVQRRRLTILPPSGAAMLIGMVAGGFLRLTSIRDGFRFSGGVFFYGLLPPIIYTAGFSLRKRSFFRNFATICTFAVAGTILSALAFGFGVYGLYAAGVMAESSFGKQPMLECLLYGTLISAIDPVATLAVFSDVEATPLLHNLVFGESVLNDAVAIVLFRTLERFHDTSDEGETFSASTLPRAALYFLWVSVGSIIIGVVVALLCARVLKMLKLSHGPSTCATTSGQSLVAGAPPAPPAVTVTDAATALPSSLDTVSYEISILLLGTYAAYLFAEAFRLSGIMSLFFAGIFHSHYAHYNVSTAAADTITRSFGAFAFLSETFVFTYLGLQVATAKHTFDVALIGSALPLCLFSRAANTFPLAALCNRRRKAPIPFNMQLMIWLSGLRGAVSYALAVNFPATSSEPDAEGNPAVETATLFVIVCTTLLLGGTTAPALKALKLRARDVERLGEDAEERGIALNGETAALLLEHEDEEENGTGFSGSGGLSSADGSAQQRRRASFSMHARWNHFDNQYMKPVFGGRGSASPAAGGSDRELESGAALLAAAGGGDHGAARRASLSKLQRQTSEAQAHDPGNRSGSSGDLSLMMAPLADPSPGGGSRNGNGDSSGNQGTFSTPLGADFAAGRAEPESTDGDPTRHHLIPMAENFSSPVALPAAAGDNPATQ